MGHDKRFKEVRFLFLRKKFYLGLFILLPAFFCLFSLGAFLIVFAKLQPLLKSEAGGLDHLIIVYDSIKTWTYIFSVVAFVSGLVVAYSLVKPARRLLREKTADMEEFGSLGHEFRDIATSLSQYIATVESMAGGIITTTKDGTITTANRQALQMLGMDKEAVLKTNIRKIFPIKETQVQKEATITLEVNAVTGEGIRQMECTIFPIRGQAGIEGAVFSFRDTQRIKEMHRELIKTERLASIGTLTMTVAHEVRNPLASIKGFAQLIKEDIKNEDHLQTYLDTIIKEVDRLNRVVDSLYEIKDSTFEGDTLKEILKRIRLLCDQALSRKAVNVVEDYDEKADSYIVKDEMVFQGLYNIVLNAYEAVKPAGNVVLTVRADSGGAKVEVISESELEEKFSVQRLFDYDVSTKGRGRGAGLAIANSAIKQAGGNIEVKSLKGKTVFSIWLP
ncbi:MAG: PAS domain S-box protein [Nitrospirae bacterium]|nr:PAS domain S-box protein [Nitrospirota bacterium]